MIEQIMLSSRHLLSPFESYNEIIPNLWLGNLKSCYDDDFLKKKKIKAIVSLYTPFLKKQHFLEKNIAVYQIKITDNISLKSNLLLYNQLDSINIFINNFLKKNIAVLIHCHYGWQRSASTCAAFLMYKYKITKSAAMRHVQIKRRFALFPDSSFELALRLYEKNLKKKNILFNNKCKI
jgi:protein-tyrosine phosphatase